MRILTLLLVVYLSTLSSSATTPTTPTEQLPALRASFSSRQCSMCRMAVGLVNYALKTRRGADQVQRIANTYCQVAHIESRTVCSDITRLFNHEVVKVLSHGVFTSDQICGVLSNNTCGTFHDPRADWEVNLQSAVTLDHEELSKMRAIERARSSPSQPYRVIHISDTHVDLEYATGSISNCDDPICCRVNSTKQWSLGIQPAGYWGSYGKCDIPMRTFESALRYLNQTLQSDPSVNYIIWTGDIQPHNVWEQTRETALNTFEMVFSKIFEIIPNVRIFPTFGNHEMVPVDSFSPSNMLGIAQEDSPQWLYQKFDEYWSRWLPESTLSTITKDGFYATVVRPGLKIISLNTNFCHTTNFWLYINSTDPGNQLQWLVHELQISELEHEQVHIIGHIPPGSSDCMKAWAKNYNKIIRHFSRTVTGQFFGHTHNSEFEIFYSKDATDIPSIQSLPSLGRRARRNVKHEIVSSWQPASVGFIGPSITTFIGLNPSFRSYLIDPSRNFEPIDFDTYFMNLTLANSLPVGQEPAWISVGSFSKMFDIADISSKSLHNLMLELVKELTVLENIEAISATDFVPAANPIDLTPESKGSIRPSSKLFKMYKQFNSFSDLISSTKFDDLTPVKKREFLCNFFTSQSRNFEACQAFINHNLKITTSLR